LAAASFKYAAVDSEVSDMDQTVVDVASRAKIFAALKRTLVGGGFGSEGLGCWFTPFLLVYSLSALSQRFQLRQALQGRCNAFAGQLFAPTL
jgi:hypothetical protein